MSESNQYNATDAKVKPPKVDEKYVADLRSRMRAARENFQEASSRFEVLSESRKQARAR